jgi:hypothetical protein
MERIKNPVVEKLQEVVAHLDAAKKGLYGIVETQERKSPLLIEAVRHSVLFLDTAYLWANLVPGAIAADEAQTAGAGEKE